jgi:L-ascorbate metabolism protein UlaG (beta-lactamase superfamily)
VDILILPIGGRNIGNTMDEDEALEAVKIITPKMVIPAHYDCPALFRRSYNPARVEDFRDNVENLGAKCTILVKGQTIEN